MGNIKIIREIKYIHIAKAPGIIAVVIGHSGSPITHFIYQWQWHCFSLYLVISIETSIQKILYC